MGSLRRKFRRVNPSSEKYNRWQRAKYFILIALLLMAAGGGQFVGVFDPFSVFYRSIALTVMPAVDVGMSEFANGIYLSDPHLGPLHLRDLTDPLYRWWQDHVTATELRVFTGTDIIFLIFIAAALLNIVKNRFWCRYICPLGANLGLVSQRPLLRLVNDPQSCNGCMKCTLSGNRFQMDITCQTYFNR